MGANVVGSGTGVAGAAVGSVEQRDQADVQGRAAGNGVSGELMGRRVGLEEVEEGEDGEDAEETEEGPFDFGGGSGEVVEYPDGAGL